MYHNIDEYSILVYKVIYLEFPGLKTKSVSKSTRSNRNSELAARVKHCGPPEFESRGNEAVFVMASAQNGFGFYGIGLCATVS